MTAEKKTVERKNGVALWRQIADRIRSSIGEGEFTATGMLPPEMELAARFGVNRHTVRSAIGFLADEGLLSTVQGRGTMIRERKRFRFPISRRTRFSQGLSDQARELEIGLVESHVEPASEEIAAALKIAPGADCVMMQTVSTADGQPVSCSRHHFPADRFAGIDAAFAQSKSITKAFVALGLADYVRISTEISGRHADNEERLLLKLAPGAIVLETVAVNADPDLRPVQYSRTSFAADRVSLNIET